MSNPKLEQILNDFGFLQIIPEHTEDYDDCTDPNQVKGFWDQKLEDEE